MQKLEYNIVAHLVAGKILRRNTVMSSYCVLIGYSTIKGIEVLRYR